MLQEVWELAKTAGPFGTLLLLILHYRGDKERREAQQQTFQLAMSNIKAMNALEASVNSRSDAMRSMEGALRAVAAKMQQPVDPVPTARKRRGT